MAKSASKPGEILARAVKIAVVAALVPVILGLLHGLLSGLEITTASGGTFREWSHWGFTTYVGVHLILYRPVELFQASHRIFSTIAVWLFGGSVGSVESAGGKGKLATKGGASQGSTLVAFSPYVVPLYMILACLGGGLLRQWVDRAWLDGPVAFLAGWLMAFHWLMTADDLQQQRDRWHMETYLLAIGLVFIVTLLIGGACLPWAVPEFSFLQALGDALDRTRAIYATAIDQLFFN